MTNKMEKIMPEFERLKRSEVKGSRMMNSITFNPDRVSPGEDLYVSVPRLKPGVCIVPNTMYLTGKFTNKNTKSWFLNNLGKLLVSALEVTIGGEVCYSNTHESIYRVYKDLWESNKERANMVDQGIANENVRKLQSKDDTGDKTVLGDAFMNLIIGNTVKIKLGQILNNHGAYAPYSMNSSIRYKVTIALAKDIMIAQTGSAVEGFILEGLRLEYETIENPELARMALNGYEVGRSLSFEHITCLRVDEWDKSATVVNTTINLPRKSMKAIVMLFKNKEQLAGSEKYFYPSIENVHVSIEGVPNAIFSKGMQGHHFFTEARRFFLDRKHDTMAIDDFYAKDNFALVIDLRSFNDSNVVGSGKRIVNAESGVLLEIKKTATTNHIKCYIYVVSDGIVNFANGTMQNVEVQ